MKVYTVTLPGGMKRIDYEAYVRLLIDWGIDLATPPRILDGGTPSHWLYAWNKRADGERFAKELRAVTRQKHWKVEEFDSDRVTYGPLFPVEIGVNRQRSGSTYGLRPFSRMLIAKKFPHARMVPSVFIAADGQQGSERHDEEPIWEHVAMILTGLDSAALNELGGYRIYDPVTGEVFREPDSLIHASAANG